jgi:hypothetical protein
MRSKRDYPVGYGKPPEHSRFQKGVSGNSRGRPRGAKNLMILVVEALDQQVTVTENGRRRKISKREAIVAQLVNRSIKADHKAMQMLFGLVQEIERRAGGSTETAMLNEADRQVLRFIRSRRGGQSGGGNVGS